MASKTAGSFEKVSKVVETISKRTTQTDVDNQKNILLENAGIQNKFHSLKLMAIVYESLKACRSDGSAIGSKSVSDSGKIDCNADSVAVSKTVTSVHKDYNAVIGFTKRFARLITNEEQNKVNKLFHGYNELIKFSKRATQTDSYLYRSYSGIIGFSKGLFMTKTAEQLNENAGDTDVQSYSYLESLKQFSYSMTDLATIRKGIYSIYSYSTFWMTRENAGFVLQKSLDAQNYILENATVLFLSAVALKDVDREGYNKFYQDLREYLNTSVLADLSMIVYPTCLIKTIDALAKAHLESTGEARMSYSTTSILLDATSMLLEMFNLRSAETDKFMKWLKQCNQITGIEAFLAMIFIQLLSIIMHCYARNGKTMDDLFNDIRGKLGMDYKNEPQINVENLIDLSDELKLTEVLDTTENINVPKKSENSHFEKSHL